MSQAESNLDEYEDQVGSEEMDKISDTEEL